MLKGNCQQTKPGKPKGNAELNLLGRDRSQSCDSEIDDFYIVDQQTVMAYVLIKLA